MLNVKKSLKILLLFTMALIFTVPVLAQDDDMLDDDMLEMEGTQEEVKCRPDSLITPWDLKFANDSEIKVKYGQNLSFGKDYFNKKNYDKAAGYLWKALMAADDAQYKKWIIRKLLECYYNRGIKLKGEEAVAYLDSALIMSYRGLEVEEGTTFHYWCASIQKLLQRYSCAIPHYEKLVAADSKNKGYWQSLAQMYARVKDVKAIAAQQKVVELDPDDKEARARLEQFEMVLGSGNLLDIYEDSYNKDPNNPEYAWKYGNELLILGEFVKAVPVFQQYLKIKPEGFDAYSKLGEAYYGDLQYKKAIANYNAYLKRNAQDYSAMVKLGDIYREQQSLQTAVNYAYKALRIKAGYGEAYILIGKTYRDAVSYCSSKREKSGISYDDKLVYEKAYYVLAKALKDPESAGRAENLRRNLKVSIPTKSEKFLHQNRTKIRGKCYSWIK